MTNLADKGRADEAQAAINEENLFKASAKRNKRIGIWFASEILGLNENEAIELGTQTVKADLEEKGDEDVLRFLRAKADAMGKTFDEAQLRTKMTQELDKIISELKNT